MHYQAERTNGCRISDSWTYRNLKTAILENELLRVVVLVDKGADIYQLIHKQSDTDFLFRSPWGVRDPSKFIPTTGWPAGKWLDVYEGGWQSMFPAAGFPSNHNGTELGLHAEVNTIPWDCEITEDTPDQVSLRCWVKGVRMPFSGEKTLTLKSNSPILHIQETITNEGEEPEMCVWGQHIALGSPFLSEDCILDLPGGKITHASEWHPNNRFKPDHESRWPTTKGKDGTDIDLHLIPPKQSKIMDLGHFSELPEGWYAVTNRKLDLGFGVVFPKDIYKYLWYWQVFGGGSGYPWYSRTYNVGIEPASAPPAGLESAVANNTALKFDAGESKTADLKVVAFSGVNGVSKITNDGVIVPRD